MAFPIDPGEPSPYEVVLTDVADAEKEAVLEYLAQRSADAQGRWFQDLSRALNDIAWSPRLGAVAPDTDAYDIGVRQVSFGKGRNRYRVLYHIVDEDRLAVVLHIRQTAQRLLTDREEGR
jgi:hypothetical protein